MKKLYWVILFVIPIAVVGLVLWVSGPQTQEGVSVVRRGAITASITALGRVQPARQASLSVRSGGTVARVLVAAGDEVAAGTPMLELESRDYARSVGQARRALEVSDERLQAALRAPQASEITIARARVRQATALRLKAQRDYDEVADQPDAESSDEALALEAAKLEYEIAQAQFDATMRGTPELDILRLQVELEQARAALDRAEAQLADTRLLAPFEGTVMRVIPSEGENIGGYTPAVVLADLTSLEIRAEIDELDVASVQVGQDVELTFDAFPGVVVTGTLTMLMPGPNDSRGTVIYEGTVRYDGEGLAVRPGMGANLTIVTQRVEGTLLVPRRAVQKVGRHQVVRVKSGRQEEHIIVTTGLSNEAEIQILSGLEEGQTIVLD